MTTDEGEDPPDDEESKLDEGDLEEVAKPRPKVRRRRAPAQKEQPAGVPTQGRWSVRQVVWGAVLLGAGLLLAVFVVLTGRASRERADGQCTGAITTASVHLGRGDLDLAEQTLSFLGPECRAENTDKIAALQRAIADKKLELAASADEAAKDAHAARELEAVESFPTMTTAMRKNFKEAAGYLARNNLEKAAGLVVPCRSSLDRVKGTSVGATADWTALDAQCDELRAKVKPYMDQVQAQLEEAQRQIKATLEQDRRDGVKYTLGSHVAALTLEKMELAARYAATKDKQGFELLLKQDDDFLILKPMLKVNVIGRGALGQPFVCIHVRGTTTDLWTTEDALKDP